MFAVLLVQASGLLAVQTEKRQSCHAAAISPVSVLLTVVNNKRLKGKYMKSVLPTYGINFLPRRKSV